MLPKHFLSTIAILPHPDAVLPYLQQKGQTLPAEEVHPPVSVSRVGLEEVQVVQLAQALVDTPAEAPYGDNVKRGPLAGVVVLADVADSLAKVGRLLIWVLNHLCRGASGLVVCPCFGG